jgi:Protein of unknown function (DUF2924)
MPSWPEATINRSSERLLQQTESCSDMNTLDSELAALPTLSAQELRLKWRDLHCGEPMAPASRDLMIREVAYQLQERVHGGLALTVKRRLRGLAQELELKGTRASVPAPLLKPSTRLLREWSGKTHTVLVLQDGFEHDGERYQSLTQLARRITGAHWSGPRFFGLRQARDA